MENFQWTTELVNEYIQKFGVDPSHPYQIQQLQDFKKSKEKNIPKQDWEILSYYGNGNIVPVGGFNPEWLQQCLLLGHKIHSVKRQDGEIFSIGDEIDEMGKGVKHFVQSFWLNHEGNDLWISTNDQKQYGGIFLSCQKG